MLSPDEIYLNLGKNIREFVDEVRIRPSDETILLYVPREKVSDTVKPGFTSGKQLENQKFKLKEKYSKDVEFILTMSERHLEIEKSVFILLNLNFSGNILSFCMSLDENNLTTAWVEIPGLDSKLENDIHQKLGKILAEVGMELGAVNWIDSKYELPTLPWILRMLKIHQPITLREMFEFCVDAYPAINEKWVNGKLDQLRKKKLVIREKSGGYVLTAAGLNSVPSGARHNSSDISRALELGRKKWSN